MRVLTVDLRNHGQSPHVEHMDYSSMAADVEALMDRLEIARSSLVGHSMGGKIAMELAVVRPERVERLVVLDIAPQALVDGVREVLDALLEVDLAGAHSREDADARLAERLGDRQLRAFLLMGLKRADDGRFGWKFNLNAIAADWGAIKGSVSTGRFEGPVLFLRGERSAHVREKDRPSILERFPRARIESIAGAGHWLHAEAPEATFSAVREFLYP
jgi:esterase